MNSLNKTFENKLTNESNSSKEKGIPKDMVSNNVKSVSTFDYGSLVTQIGDRLKSKYTPTNNYIKYMKKYS